MVEKRKMLVKIKKLYIEICKTPCGKYYLPNAESTNCKIKIDRREKKISG